MKVYTVRLVAVVEVGAPRAATENGYMQTSRELFALSALLKPV